MSIEKMSIEKMSIEKTAIDNTVSDKTLVYKILSALLEYPEPELLDALPEIRGLIKDSNLPQEQQRMLESFIQRMASTALTEQQQEYVQTFDLTPEYSLHLTHHLFGDDRGRGPALIDLTEYYKQFGLQADATELPDYLPMILEFAAQLEDTEAQLFLSQTVKILQQLGANLEQAGSPYAPLIRIVEHYGQLAPIAA